MNAGNSVNTHFSLKGFKHLSNFCKILLSWVLNLMLKLPIKLTHQLSAVIDCSSSIIVYILIIGKNLNYLSNFSTSPHFSWCKRGHTHLKFHKFIIHSVIRTRFFILLLTIIMITFFLKMFFIIFLIFCIISSVLASVLNFIMKRRDLKALLAPIQVKREVSEGGRFRGKSSSLTKHCWSKCDHKF